jgi:hypothetical protein
MGYTDHTIGSNGREGTAGPLSKLKQGSKNTDVKPTGGTKTTNGGTKTTKAPKKKPK